MGDFSSLSLHAHPAPHGQHDADANAVVYDPLRRNFTEPDRCSMARCRDETMPEDEDSARVLSQGRDSSSDA